MSALAIAAASPVTKAMTSPHPICRIRRVLGADERCSPLQINNFMYLSLMEEAVRRGLRLFDFGRTRKDNPGPYAFKCNQGFAPRSLPYQVLLREAHTLKGALKVLGAAAAAGLALDLERLAGHGDLSSAREVGAALDRSMGRLTQELLASKRG